MERAVQVFAIIHLFTMGMSHILAPRAWAEFFIRLRERGAPGVFITGWISLAFGSIIAAFHPVWTGIPMVLTLLGWAQVLKGVLYFLFPSYGMRGLARVSIERAHHFIYAGVALLLFAALIGYHVLTA